MTLKELIKYLRTSILDDTGGTGVLWEDLTEDDIESEQLKWTNEELASYINEATKQSVRRSLLIKDDSTDFNITLVADTAKYSIDPKILQIEGIRSTATGKRLIPISLEDIWNTTDFDTLTGIPSSYVADYTNSTIRVSPIPSEADTLKLLVYRLPLEDLTWGSPDASPELREEQQIPMLNYAAHLAYLKDEANTLDPNRSATFLALFTREFSDTSVYSETRKRRAGRGTVSYGGIK